jgi:hypothetical protein
MNLDGPMYTGCQLGSFIVADSGRFNYRSVPWTKIFVELSMVVAVESS